MICNIEKPLLMALAVSFSLLGFVTEAQAGVIQIGLGSFDDAKVLDFESSADGPIAITDPLFTDFGISNIVAISASGNSNVDTYNSPFGGGRSLFRRNNIGFETGFFLDSLGAPDTQFSTNSTWVIEFSETHNRVGFSLADMVGTNVTVIFRNNLVTVESITFTHFGGFFSNYFETTSEFDDIVIETSSTDGFGIDSITLESSSVPEPSSFAMMGFGLIGMAGYGWRRKRKLAA